MPRNRVHQVGVCNECKQQKKIINATRGLCSACYKKIRKKDDFQYLDLNQKVIGQRYGRLVVVDIDKKRGSNGGLVVVCKCDCGRVHTAELKDLKQGCTTSCGCYQKECAKKHYEQNIKFDKEHGYFDNTCANHLTSKISSANTSGVKGVSFNKQYGKYETYITIKGKRYHLGMFKNLENARKARQLAEEKYFDPVLQEFDEFLKSIKKEVKE